MILATTQRTATTVGRLLPGLGVCTLIALVAWFAGSALPLIGAPVMAILFGIVVGNSCQLDETTTTGIQFGMKTLLQWAIIGLGLRLDLFQLWHVGLASLHVTLVTLAIAFISALLLGRWLKLSTATTLMIGTGTAICGGSAIAAIAPILRPKERELTLALATIFFFNIVAVLLFPALGHWLQLSDHGFGLWAGTAINDTSSVVAAAYSFSQAAGDTATIVKLTRASLIVPVCLLLSLLVTVRRKEKTSAKWHATFPWFIVGFVLMAAIHTLGWLPVTWESDIAQIADFTLVMALAAVGLSCSLPQLAQAGIKPILLGLGVWVMVATSSLGVQWLSGGW